MLMTLAWLVPLAAVWAGATWFFWRAGAWLPYYLTGAAGASLLAIIGARNLFPGELWLRTATAGSVHLVSNLMGLHTSLATAEAGSLMVVGVPHHNEWTVLSIGLECSGLLESAALFGLVAFFPAQSWSRRAGVLGIALGATFVANIIRMMVIVLAVAWLGQGALDVAHVILGRVVFFTLAIGIYWFAITRPTLSAVSMRLRESR